MNILTPKDHQYSSLTEKNEHSDTKRSSIFFMERNKMNILNSFFLVFSKISCRHCSGKVQGKLARPNRHSQFKAI